jgi:hypothetical protein
MGGIWAGLRKREESECDILARKGKQVNNKFL